MKREAIQPCPKCGEKKRLYIGSSDKHHWVICTNCGTESLLAESKRDAVWFWNEGFLRDDSLGDLL